MGGCMGGGCKAELMLIAAAAAAAAEALSCHRQNNQTRAKVWILSQQVLTSFFSDTEVPASI